MCWRKIGAAFDEKNTKNIVNCWTWRWKYCALGLVDLKQAACEYLQLFNSKYKIRNLHGYAQTSRVDWDQNQSQEESETFTIQMDRNTSKWMNSINATIDLILQVLFYLFISSLPTFQQSLPMLFTEKRHHQNTISLWLEIVAGNCLIFSSCAAFLFLLPLSLQYFST